MSVIKALSFACVSAIQHPAEVGTLEQEERNSDMQMGLSPFSLKFT